MCIAVYKPQGVVMPSKKILSNCFSNNSDGAGFMFPYKGKVHYEKGFMTFSAFKRALKTAIKKYNISTTQTPMVFHFRITSQGGVKPELTHPFPVCPTYEEMRKLSGDVEAAVVHNGIIDFASSFSKTIDYSDTMEFTKNVVFRLLYKNEHTYYKNKTLIGLMDYLLGSNRFVIMGSDGHVELLGSWTQDGGVYYSNSSYKSKYYSGFTSTRDITKSNYTYLFDDDDYDYDPYTPYGFYCAGTISKQQEKDFLEGGLLLDSCGYDMDIEWNDNVGCCIAVCHSCGIWYYLTNKAEDYAWKHGLVSLSDSSSDKEVEDWNKSFEAKGAK